MNPQPADNPAPSADTSASTGKLGDGANKRDYERQHLGIDGATAFEHPEGEVPAEGLPCEVFDISRSGVGIRCRKMMYGGRRVFVLLAATVGAPRSVLYGEVRYARYAERGMYHIGIKFLPVPASHGVKDWLQEQASPRKRRAA